MLKSYVTNLCDIARKKNIIFYSYVIKNNEKTLILFFLPSNITYV